jgi:hypothetical protein
MRHKLTTFILKNPPVNKDKGKKCVGACVWRVCGVCGAARMRCGEEAAAYGRAQRACASSLLHARACLGPCALNPGACVR